MAVDSKCPKVTTTVSMYLKAIFFFSLSVVLVTVESKCPLDWVQYNNNCIQFNKDQHTWMDAGVSPASLLIQGSTPLLLLLSSTKVLGVYYCMYNYIISSLYLIYSYLLIVSVSQRTHEAVQPIKRRH